MRSPLSSVLMPLAKDFREGGFFSAFADPHLPTGAGQPWMARALVTSSAQWPL